MPNCYSFKNFIELTERESDEVLQGRNDEQVRRWMASDRLITPDEHRRFMASLKMSVTQIYLRVERTGRFVGVYSLTDLRDRSAVGGFWIAAYARERLLSLSVVFHSIGYVFNNCPIESIRGYQLADNQPVAKLNALLGFVHGEAPANPDPRMRYLELVRESWESGASRDRKLLKLIKLAENMNED